jgi:hypothetical protein
MEQSLAKKFYTSNTLSISYQQQILAMNILNLFEPKKGSVEIFTHLFT